MNDLVGKAARRFRERLENQLGPRLLETRLFGSRARGDAGPESDLDIFVLVDSEEQRLLPLVVAEANAVLHELELPFAISPLVMERAHFQDLQDRELRLARDIAREGIPL